MRFGSGRDTPHRSPTNPMSELASHPMSTGIAVRATPAPGDRVAGTRLPTEKELCRELARFAQPSTALGLSLFVAEYLVYVVALGGVLWLPSLPWKILASLVAGFQLGKLSLFAHDAAHGATTGSRRLNRAIALAAMTPILYNYQLWSWDHNTRHHRYPNGDHPDAFVPLSKAEFDALPRWRRMVERIARAPCVVGFGVYFIIVRWYETKFFPRQHVPRNLRPKAWEYFRGLVVYVILWTALLAAAPMYSSTGSLTAIGLGFLVPVFVFNTLFGATLFFQHNHPRVPWFRGPVDRENFVRPEYVTTHLMMPRWMAKTMHSVFDHAVHHVNPRIPLYRAFEAQQYLNQRLRGAPIVVEPFSPANLLRTLRICKLYDFERHCWTDFAGRPTSEAVPLIAQTSSATRGETRS